MTSTNPWLTGPEQSPEPQPDVASPSTRMGARVGRVAPQAGVAGPDTADRLPRYLQTWPATVWWLGVHGGAGESILSTLAAGSRSAQHGWPIPDTAGTAHHVVLVARTNWVGLTAAQRAATEWASGALGDGVQLAGLVLIADAPGRLPKPLRDLQQVISGGVPRVWTLPWVDAWRLGPAEASTSLPREFRALLADLQLTASSSAHN